MARPPKPPFSAGRVVKAALLLNDALKLLWLEHVALDGPEGAFIGAGPMGRRLGASRDTIERGRRELVRLGLLTTGPHLKGATGTYYPTLPTDYTPTLRPSVSEVARCAAGLDKHILAIRSGDTDSPTPRPAALPGRCVNHPDRPARGTRDHRELCTPCWEAA